MPSAEQIIRRLSRKYDLDPQAVISVAMGEGGLRNRQGDVGDLGGGGSYGPFQLYAQGMLPAQFRGRPQAADRWAWSPAGIEYALRHMSKHARGKQGAQAINAIIRQFERPADPDSSVRNALSRYGAVRPGGGRAPRAGGGRPGASRNGSGFDRKAYAISTLNAIAAGEWDPMVAFSQLDDFRTQKRATNPGRNGRVPEGLIVNGKGFVQPLPTKWNGGSEFGSQDAEGAPSANGGRYHAAKDWFAPAGSPVVSPVSGKIVEIKASQGNSGQIFGGVVKVMDKNGRVFVFRHVDPRKLKVGARVDAGALIARVSKWTGGNPHAHVEIWKTLKGGYRYENMIDPALIFG